VSGTDLVGRDAELDAIGRLIEAAARGESSMLLVRGEAGIGKTRLLDRLCDRAAERRFAVLRGRATELESDVPFAAVAEALEPLDDVALATPARQPSGGGCTGGCATGLTRFREAIRSRSSSTTSTGPTRPRWNCSST
jgi:predicted ATPase